MLTVLFLALGQLSSPALAPTTQLIAAARAQVGATREYDAAYTRLRYPLGDVPLERGVCTDVVVRALRAVGVDLQRLVHEDMTAHFEAYPRAWGLTRADANIDHRRVLNLRTFFARRGKEVSGPPQPGDVLTVTVPPGRPHIMVVSSRRGPTGQWLVIHNIGAGTQEEDLLEAYPRTGHFRWFGGAKKGN
jgi:uncharacterized protein